MDTQDLPTCALRQGIDAALSGILDPEYGLPITDLGLVLRVEINGDAVDVALTLTTPACPAGGVILDGVRAAVQAVPGVGSANVFLEWDPPWRPERLSPAARRHLGWDSAG